jgi:2-keto-4-pentenoate hydratase/2-oxohepta-3-ene-1,7-dioic acid hydratase in catechol pathway
MRLCRFGEGRLGVVEGSSVRDITAALDALPAFRYPFPRHDLLIANLDAVIARARTMTANAPLLSLQGLNLLSPVANPGKILAAPVNYQKHLDEVCSDSQLHHGQSAHTAPIQTSGMFLKATSSLVGPSQGVAIRKLDRRTDHEVELALVVGKQASNVTRREAMDCIAGYSIGLDISIRGPEERSLRKSVDTYAVLGPWLVTRDEISNPGELGLQIAINGEIRQKSNTKYLILGAAELVEYASSFYTLYPGDIIMTGTPEGVSPIQPGDEIVAEIEKIGTMRVSVRGWEEAETPAAVSGVGARGAS